MGSLLMHASIPITHASLWCFFFFFFLCIFFSFLSFSSLFYLFFFCSLPAFFPCSSYCSQLPPFILSDVMRFAIFISQLLLSPHRCPSKTAHWPANCRATTIAQNVLVAPLLIPRQKWLVLFLISLCFHYSYLDKD